MENNKKAFNPAVSEEMAEFILRAVRCYIGWDIITYLSMGREKKVATIEEISDSIGRDAKEIIPVLDNLVGRGYIEKTFKLGKYFYVITSDKQLEQKVYDFVKYASTRQGRLNIIYLITKSRMEN